MPYGYTIFYNASWVYNFIYLAEPKEFPVKCFSIKKDLLIKTYQKEIKVNEKLYE